MFHNIDDKNSEFEQNATVHIFPFGNDAAFADGLAILNYHKIERTDAETPLKTARRENLKYYGERKDPKLKLTDEATKQLQEHKNSACVYYDADVFVGNINNLNRSLSRKKSDEYGETLHRAERDITKHRIITSHNSFFNNDEGQEELFDTLMVTACAPNFRMDRRNKNPTPENPNDRKLYLNSNGTLNVDAYKAVMKKLWSNMLRAADINIREVVIAPLFGCGAYTRALEKTEREKAVSCMATALQEVLSEQTFTHVKGFVFSIPRDEDGNVDITFSQVTNAMVSYKGTIPIIVTDAGIMKATATIESSGMPTALINPSADKAPGGGYHDVDVSALEEQLWGVSDASEVVDAALNPVLYHPAHQIPLKYDVIEGYLPITEANQEGIDKKSQTKKNEKTSKKSNEAPLKGGMFVKTYLRYEQHSKQNTEKQARTILDKVREYKNKGFTKVGIIYSANRGQTEAIRLTYAKKDKEKNWKTETSGANQAEVMYTVEELLKNEKQYQDLRGVFRILPITTQNLGPNDPAKQEWLVEDLNLIQSHLEEGQIVLGWQNQDTVAHNAYAVGGGINKNLKSTKMTINGKEMTQHDYVQGRLNELAENFKEYKIESKSGEKFNLNDNNTNQSETGKISEADTDTEEHESDSDSTKKMMSAFKENGGKGSEFDNTKKGNAEVQSTQNNKQKETSQTKNVLDAGTAKFLSAESVKAVQSTIGDEWEIGVQEKTEDGTAFRTVNHSEEDYSFQIYANKLTTNDNEYITFKAMLKSFIKIHGATNYPKITTDAKSYDNWKQAFEKAYGKNHGQNLKNIIRIKEVLNNEEVDAAKPKPSFHKK